LPHRQNQIQMIGEFASSEPPLLPHNSQPPALLKLGTGGF
jgi:hypothetical protein